MKYNAIFTFLLILISTNLVYGQYNWTANNKEHFVIKVLGTKSYRLSNTPNESNLLQKRGDFLYTTTQSNLVSKSNLIIEFESEGLLISFDSNKLTQVEFNKNLEDNLAYSNGKILFKVSRNRVNDIDSFVRNLGINNFNSLHCKELGRCRLSVIGNLDTLFNYIEILQQASDVIWAEPDLLMLITPN